MLVCKPGNQLNSRQYNTAHKWGEFFRFYMFLIKVLNNVGRLYPFIRKNFKELPRKQNDTTSVLWRVQYFNGKNVTLLFFQTEMPFQKLNILETRTFSIATDLTFPFHLAMKKWIQAAIPAVHPQISISCPSRLGRWKNCLPNLLIENIY